MSDSVVKGTTLEDQLNLIEQGFEPVPILASEKRPLLKGWTADTITEERLKKWREDHPDHTSTGCRTGHLAMFDNDLLDLTLAERISAVVTKILGDTPYQRYGAKAKQVALEKTLYAVSMAEAMADQIAGKEAGTKKIGIAERFHSKAKQLGVAFDENDLNPPISATPAPEVKVVDNMPTKPDLPEDALAKMNRLYREGKDGEAVALGIASGLLIVDKEDREGGQDHADA